MSTPTPIRTVKRRARQAELGIMLGLYLLVVEAWKRTPLIGKLLLGALFYLVATLIVIYWKVAAALLLCWLLWRLYRNQRIRRTWGSVRTWKMGKAEEECPYCQKVHPAAQWCAELEDSQ